MGELSEHPLQVLVGNQGFPQSAAASGVLSSLQNNEQPTLITNSLTKMPMYALHPPLAQSGCIPLKPAAAQRMEIFSGDTKWDGEEPTSLSVIMRFNSSNTA